MCTQPHPNCLESISSCFATIHVRADKYDNKIEKFFVEYEELGPPPEPRFREREP